MLLLVGARADAGTITLAWDQNPEPDVAGYLIVYGTQPGDYSSSIDVGNRTQYTVTNLADGTYYFAVEAYNTEGFTSAPSNETEGTVVDSVAVVGGDDFNADGRNDVVWQNDLDGRLAMWTMSGASRLSESAITPSPIDTNWKIVGSADFNADGQPDLLWQDTRDGWLLLWTMNGATRVSATFLTPNQVSDTTWKVVGVEDMNGDNQPDLLWRNTSSGTMILWTMNGTTRMAATVLSNQVTDRAWRVAAIADFNGDGRADLLWQHQSQGYLIVWYMDAGNRLGSTSLSPSQVTDSTWKVIGASDLNGDGSVDLLWRNTATHNLIVWWMQGAVRTGTASVSPSTLSTDWTAVNLR